MSETNPLGGEDLEESFDLENYLDDEDDDEEPTGDPAQPVAPRATGSNSTVAQLEAEVERLKAVETDLNKRLGNAIQVHGKRLKDKDEEVQGWLEQTVDWAQEELDKSKREGFQEAVTLVEGRLLQFLDAKDKADYLTAMRTEQPAPSQRKAPEFKTRQSTSSPDTTSEVDVTELVKQFTATGVPLDQIDQTSAAAVVASAAKYWQTPKVIEDNSQELEPQAPVSTDRRVSTGIGGTSKGPRMSKDIERLDEINRQLRRLQGNGNASIGMPLVREKQVITARLEAARKRMAA